MTAHDERDLVEQLLSRSGEDHVRGCEGRAYVCSCGHDVEGEGLFCRAADEITRLRTIETEAKLAGWLFNDDGSIIRPASSGDFMTAIEQANEIIRDRRLEGEAKDEEIARLRSLVAEQQAYIDSVTATAIQKADTAEASLAELRRELASSLLPLDNEAIGDRGGGFGARTQTVAVPRKPR